MLSRFSLLLIYQSLTFPVIAEQYNSSYHPTTFFPQPCSPQYRSFFHMYSPCVIEASIVRCATTFTDYSVVYQAPPPSLKAQQFLSICYQHEQCILDNIPSHILANSNFATLVLYLMPKLLSTIVPSIAEMTLLSVYRPGLSFLIASLELGRNSILSWGCTTTFGPLLWTSLIGVVNRVAGFSFTYARSSASSLQGSVDKRTRDWSITNRLRKSMEPSEKEFTLCAEQTLGRNYENANVPPLAVMANVLAGCSGFIHLLFSIIIFSSLQLVSLWDVLNSVLCRYVASAVVCRLVLVFGIGGLRDLAFKQQDESTI
ncbi:hypothetical protein PSV08DRAFT_368688 [Bipolaris maydis]|uniref:uncharacterized protein n=1 Tax=Cochliobolus heterostrophus TaxID=5016 RepID=UPI0024CE716C|nr:hypothetical protein J3E73DRAFT_387685 [Bipolaris maydis]KAJ6275340.1 hypothetical protein PSV08DRAFT_368688 [Bipolaris maydis]KAJ6285369.1 hypothetical protein J3E71DRAFT_358381 [Bipolaris maydis]